jgi:outer membrane receptor protein involved in Fe transport
MGVSALLLAALLAATTPANSTAGNPEEKEKKPAVEETIVVTATRSERAVSELPMSATVITEEEIRSAPVRSVDDLIRTIPGVHMPLVSASGSTPSNQRVSMHGLGGSRALVLLDGIPLHDPYSGTVQWQKVPLESIRQIEVVRGGNASLFGNFALGGTINLITRPVEQQLITVDAAYGTSSTGRARISIDQPLTDTLAIRLSDDRSDTNGYFRVPNSGPVDVHAWVESAITSARADYRPSDGVRAWFNASTQQLDMSQGTPIGVSKRDMVSTSAGMHRSSGASGLLSVNAYYQRQKEFLVNSTVNGPRTSEVLTQDAMIPSTGYGASIEWSMQRRGVIPFLSVGVDLQQLEAEEDRLTYSRTGAVTQRNLVGGRQRFAGIFAQASWQPNDRLEILASARLDTFRNEEGRDVIVGGEALHFPDASANQVDPRVSVRYELGARSAVRASAYRAFNAPILRDLYRKTQTGSSIVYGNPFLAPETLVGAEVGWEHATERTHVEVNLYRSVIDGLQARGTIPGAPANSLQIMNLGKARSQGVELMADLRLSRRWSMDAGYTYADAKIVSDPDPAVEGNLMPEVSPHIGTLSVRFRGDRGTNVDVRGRVLSRSYGETANLAVAPAHRVVDLSMSQRLRSWVDAYALVENAFDERYWLALTPTALRAAMPRTITAGFRVSLGAGH